MRLIAVAEGADVLIVQGLEAGSIYLQTTTYLNRCRLYGKRIPMFRLSAQEGFTNFLPPKLPSIVAQME
jgi:hypothetical protein